MEKLAELEMDVRTVREEVSKDEEVAEDGEAAGPPEILDPLDPEEPEGEVRILVQDGDFVSSGSVPKTVVSTKAHADEHCGEAADEPEPEHSRIQELRIQLLELESWAKTRRTEYKQLRSDIMETSSKLKTLQVKYFI